MTPQKKTNNDRIFSGFWHRHLILCNSLLIVLAIPVLSWLGLLFVDLWTHHGSTTVVPNVKNMNYDKAVEVLEEADLKVVIGDSIYSTEKAPGEVVEIFPKPGAVVKPGREVYLTIVSFSPQQVILDVPVVDQSVKSAIAYLKNKGIRTIKIVRVPSQYPDLVLSMKYNGTKLNIGSKVPVTATIVLEVGESEVPVYESNESLDDAIDAAMDAETQEANTENLEEQTVSEPFAEPETSGEE